MTMPSRGSHEGVAIREVEDARAAMRSAVTKRPDARWVEGLGPLEDPVLLRRRREAALAAALASAANEAQAKGDHAGGSRGPLRRLTSAWLCGPCALLIVTLLWAVGYHAGLYKLNPDFGPPSGRGLASNAFGAPPHMVTEELVTERRPPIATVLAYALFPGHDHSASWGWLRVLFAFAQTSVLHPIVRHASAGAILPDAVALVGGETLQRPFNVSDWSPHQRDEVSHFLLFEFVIIPVILFALAWLAIRLVRPLQAFALFLVSGAVALSLCVVVPGMAVMWFGACSGWLSPWISVMTTTRQATLATRECFLPLIMFRFCRLWELGTMSVGFVMVSFYVDMLSREKARRDEEGHDDAAAFLNGDDDDQSGGSRRGLLALPPLEGAAPGNADTGATPVEATPARSVTRSGVLNLVRSYLNTLMCLVQAAVWIAACVWLYANSGGDSPATVDANGVVSTNNAMMDADAALARARGLNWMVTYWWFAVMSWSLVAARAWRLPRLLVIGTPLAALEGSAIGDKKSKTE